MDEKQNTNMEQEPVTPASEMEASTPAPETPAAAPQEAGSKPPFGPVVGIVIVVVILAIGGFYIWGAGLTEQQQAEDPNAPTAEEIANEEDPVVQSLEAQSTSDDVASLEADLEATGLDALDEDLANIDAEF